ATGLDGFDLQFRDEPQSLFDRLERAEGLLVAVAMHHGLVGDRAKSQLQPSGSGLAHQKFLEHESLRADGLGPLVRAQRQQLVTQREKTTWLEADDRHAARRERRVGGNQTVELSTGVIDRTGRQEGAAATQRAAAACRPRNMDAIAA